MCEITISYYADIGWVKVHVHYGGHVVRASMHIAIGYLVDP
jgi:hypothetical protein